MLENRPLRHAGRQGDLGRGRVGVSFFRKQPDGRLQHLLLHFRLFLLLDMGQERIMQVGGHGRHPAFMSE